MLAGPVSAKGWWGSCEWSQNAAWEMKYQSHRCVAERVEDRSPRRHHSVQLLCLAKKPQPPEWHAPSSSRCGRFDHQASFTPTSVLNHVTQCGSLTGLWSLGKTFVLEWTSPVRLWVCPICLGCVNLTAAATSTRTQGCRWLSPLLMRWATGLSRVHTNPWLMEYDGHQIMNESDQIIKWLFLKR